MPDECLACQQHILYRIVLKFNEKANKVSMTKIMMDLRAVYSQMRFSTYSKGVFTFIVDVELDKTTAKIIYKIANDIENIIASHIKGALEQGFIEIYKQKMDVIDLLDEAKEYKCRVRLGA